MPLKNRKSMARMDPLAFIILFSCSYFLKVAGSNPLFIFSSDDEKISIPVFLVQSAPAADPAGIGNVDRYKTGEAPVGKKTGAGLSQ
jgi:hypothetical protein